MGLDEEVSERLRLDSRTEDGRPLSHREHNEELLQILTARGRNKQERLHLHSSTDDSRPLSHREHNEELLQLLTARGHNEQKGCVLVEPPMAPEDFVGQAMLVDGKQPSGDLLAETSCGSSMIMTTSSSASDLHDEMPGSGDEATRSGPGSMYKRSSSALRVRGSLPTKVVPGCYTAPVGCGPSRLSHSASAGPVLLGRLRSASKHSSPVPARRAFAAMK